MNWQTEEIDTWIIETGILISQRENATNLQELVESGLLVNEKPLHISDHLKNLAVKEFLKNVEWKELVFNPNAWDDYEYEEVTNDDENL